jgi:hypothetical protein
VVYHVPVPSRKAFATHNDHIARTLQAWRAAGARHPHLERVTAVIAGPMATVMAAELHCLGVRTIDLGYMNPFQDRGRSKGIQADGFPVPCSPDISPVVESAKGWHDPYESS